MRKNPKGGPTPEAEKMAAVEEVSMANTGARSGAYMHATAATPIYIGHMRVRSALSAGFRHRCISCSLSSAVCSPRLRALTTPLKQFQHPEATLLMRIDSYARSKGTKM